MIIRSAFKRTVFISLLGHMALFSIFSFSFGRRLSSLNFNAVSFLGASLHNPDLYGPMIPYARSLKERFRRHSPQILTNAKKEFFFARDYLKPAAAVSFNNEKLFLKETPDLKISKPKGNETAIMFYPRLPAHFNLYFKDRQAVHIELMYRICRNNAEKPSIIVQRKISSGNLEVDLLTMRYISRYLFVQQVHFPVDSWQKVKIDFSAKND